jgi:hypothetical protein
MRLAAAGKRSGPDEADGTCERGALRALVRLQVALVGPSGQLAMRGELQCSDLVV